MQLRPMHDNPAGIALAIGSSAPARGAGQYQYREIIMAWELLFTSDIGLLSLFTIGFILVMCWYIASYVTKHMKDAPPKDVLPPTAH